MRVCGYFGKRPGDRDFLFDGLPARVADRWAAMLSGWLQAAQARDPENWQRHYYGAPIWRFALAPGHLNDQIWVGVIAASADAFGRSFPLSVLISAEKAGLPDYLTGPVDQLMDRIERQLLSFLDGGLGRAEMLKDLERVSDELRRALDVPPKEHLVMLPSLRPEEFAIALPVAELQANPERPGAMVQWPAQTRRREEPDPCYWWHEGTETRPAELCISAGLPSGSPTSAFFLGDWTGAGWRARVHDSGME
ncbi:type VI secretion-associated protein [Roseibium aquae]|uniref:Type VI secretion-associated protein n=1 Tax=Roseibium aquae TaxID=1323746 RepID=A0A916THL9_9HYPH|nr:type VI secretion system-associated protein TagF [Roseibium aquae]GGB45898.1 type VI secretion-associated protein [Roseibium aquae]